MKTHYRHLFFDLDHTLWDFETNAKEALYDLYQIHQLNNKGIALFEDFFNRYSEHNHRLWNRYTNGFIRQEELKWKRMWLTLLDYKIADEVLSKTLSFQFLEKLPQKTNLFPYTIEILTYLKSEGYQLHLITNGFEIVQHKKLTNSQLLPFFNQVITSEGSNSLKPNKEIFEFAMNKANAKAQESIMIGDNVEADIQGGINAGIDTVFVNHISYTQPTKATYEVNNLKALESIF